MILRSLLAGTALLVAGAFPVAAQEAEMGPRPSVDRLPDTHTPETVPAGRQMGGPEGDVLTKPADPTIEATGPSSNPQPGGRELSSTNTIIPPVSEGEDDPGRASEPGGETEAEPAPLNVAPGQNILGTRGGAGLARYQEYGNKLSEYEVVGPNGEELGKVAGVVLNLQSGEIDTLMLSQGGFAGIGDKVFDVPWDFVSAIDKNDQRVVLEGGPELLRPNPEYGEREGVVETD